MATQSQKYDPCAGSVFLHWIAANSQPFQSTQYFQIITEIKYSLSISFDDSLGRVSKTYECLRKVVWYSCQDKEGLQQMSNYGLLRRIINGTKRFFPIILNVTHSRINKASVFSERYVESPSADLRLYFFFTELIHLWGRLLKTVSVRSTLV